MDMTTVLTLAQMGRYGFDGMDGWGWVPAIVGLVGLAALIGVVVWLAVSTARRPGQMPPTSGRARALLDERYAKGEIDREEYLQRKADLEP
jgi:putative membrane protein